MIMTCENVSDLMPLLGSPSLDDATAAAVHAHIRTCAECSAEWRIVQGVRALHVGVPADVASRIESAVAQRGVPGLQRVRGRWTPQYAVAAAAAVALVGGLLAVQQLRDNPTQLTQADTVAAPAGAGDTQGSFPVTVDPLVGNQSAVSELTEAQLEALLTEMDS